MVRTISTYMIVIMLLVAVGYYFLYSSEKSEYKNGTYVLIEVFDCNEYICRT